MEKMEKMNNMNNMEIIYFGGGCRENTLERVLCQQGFTVKLLILSSKEPYLEEYLHVARHYQLEYRLVSKKQLATHLEDLSADIYVSVGFRYIIPASIFAKPRYAINIHPALLPDYRGGFCGNYILLNGETETGITVHFIDEGVDTGDILHQVRYPLSVFDTIQSITRKNRELEPNVLIQALEMLKSGTFKREKQINGRTYPKRQPADSEIDIHQPLINQLDIIRASHREKYPAFIYLEGKKVIISLQRADISPEEKENGMI